MGTYVLTDDVNLSTESLEFSSRNPINQQVYICLKPRFTSSLIDNISSIDGNTYGLFVDSNTDDLSNTCLTNSFITTPMIYTSNINSLTDILYLNNNVSISDHGVISANTIHLTNVKTVPDMNPQELVTKYTLLDHLSSNYFDKSYTTENVITNDTFGDTVELYNLTNVADVTSQIDHYLNGGSMQLTDYVTYANVANVHQSLHVANVSMVNQMISNYVDDYDFSSYVTYDTVNGVMDSYVLNRSIPNTTQVNQLIVSAISGVPTANVDGFVTESVVEGKLDTIRDDIANVEANLSATEQMFYSKANIDALFVSRSYFDAQISNLSSTDDGDVNMQAQLLALSNDVNALENTTYTKTFIQSNFATIAGMNDAIQNVTVDQTQMNATISAALVPYSSTVQMELELTGYAKIGDVLNESTVDSKIALATIDVVSQSDVTTTLNNSLSAYSTLVQTSSSISNALNTFENVTLSQALDAFPTKSHVSSEIASSMSTVNDTISSHIYNDSLHGGQLFNKLGEYLTTPAIDNYMNANDVISNMQSATLTLTNKFDEYVTQDTLSNEYYSAAELFTNVDAKLPLWLTQNDFITKQEIESLFPNTVTENEMKMYVLETVLDNVQNMNHGLTSDGNVTPQFLVTHDYLQKMDIQRLINDSIRLYGSGNVTVPYLQENYVSTDMWFNWLHSSGGSSSASVDTSTIQNMINNSLVNVPTRSELTSSYVTISGLAVEVENILQGSTSDGLSVPTIQSMINTTLLNYSTTSQLSSTYVTISTVHELLANSSSTDVQSLIDSSLADSGFITHPQLTANLSSYVTQENMSENLTHLQANIQRDYVQEHDLPLKVNDIVSSNIEQYLNTVDIWNTYISTHFQSNVTNMINGSYANVNISELENDFVTHSNLHDVVGQLISSTYANVDIDNLKNTFVTLSAYDDQLLDLLQTSPSTIVDPLKNHFVSIDTWQDHLTTHANIDTLKNMFVSMDDWMGGPDAPVVNMYNYQVSSILKAVDYTNTERDMCNVMSADESFVRFQFNDTSRTLDNHIVQVGDRILIRNANVSTYNGIFDVNAVDTIVANIVQCVRSDDFADDANINNSMIFVKSPHDASMNNTSFLSHAINANVEFIQLTYSNFGNMAYQDATNVHITGGVVDVSDLTVGNVNANDSNQIQIQLRDNTTDSKFVVRAKNIETDEQHAVFQVDGEGTVSSYQFYSLSDRRLKQNDAIISNPMLLVNKLHGKTFEWIDESRNVNGPSYGFIAQEVRENFPSLVTETLNDNLAVDYSKIVAILVEAVKELHAHMEHAGLITDHNNVQTASNVASYIPTGNVHHTPTPSLTTEQSNVRTNIIGLGGLNAGSVWVQLASNDNDLISMSEMFGTDNDYAMFTNHGNNTLDDVNLQIDMKVLVKNSNLPKYNGVYDIKNIQVGLHGTFSICSRSSSFITPENIKQTLVFVQSNSNLVNVGTSNNAKSFICIEPAKYDESFTLNASNIEFSSIHNNLQSMSQQDSSDVNITGGSIVLDSISTRTIHAASHELAVHLNGNTSNDKFEINNGTEVVFSVDGAGVMSAHDFFQPSDSRLKKNDVTISNALQLVQKLRGVTFDWNEDSRIGTPHTQYGFIAQEVGLHFPSLVHKRADGYLAVDYSKVVSILVQAVKELGNNVNL